MRALTVAALAAALVAPAFADDQLARSLGVEPGRYSTADLILMREAREANDDLCYDTVAAHAPPAQAEAPDPAARGQIVGACRAQMARSLGVGAQDYTAAELALMREARENNDDLCYDTVASRTGEQPLSQAADDACKAPLAAAMRVNADDYSHAELSQMFLEAHGSDED